MNVMNAIAMLFIIMIMYMLIGAGTILSTYTAWEHGQTDGVTAFLLIIGMIATLLISIGVILAKINSWRSNDEKDKK